VIVFYAPALHTTVNRSHCRVMHRTVNEVSTAPVAGCGVHRTL